MVATSLMWLFTLIKIKLKTEFISCATFQVLRSQLGLVATTLNSADIGYFHHCRKREKSVCQNDTGANLKELQWLDLEKFKQRKKLIK